jgi:hypothetical protein
VSSTPPAAVAAWSLAIRAAQAGSRSSPDVEHDRTRRHDAWRQWQDRLCTWGIPGLKRSGVPVSCDAVPVRRHALDSCSGGLRHGLEEPDELVGDRFGREMRRKVRGADDLDLSEVGHVAGDVSRPLGIPGRGCP